MITLGIETSCDETALALIETRIVNGVFECKVINSLVHSQAELHSAYGGVFPTMAKREHVPATTATTGTIVVTPMHVGSHGASAIAHIAPAAACFVAVHTADGAGNCTCV